MRCSEGSGVRDDDDGIGGGEEGRVGDTFSPFCAKDGELKWGRYLKTAW